MRVYVDGVFDLFHYGHAQMLERARALGDELWVGVVTDQDARSYKRSPVLTYAERAAAVRACRHADRVVEAQLVLDSAFIERHGIHKVVHGDDSNQADFFAVPLEMGIMHYLPYTRGISTTDIINRILRRHVITPCAAPRDTQSRS